VRFTVPASCDLQKMRIRIGEFFLGHALVWLVALLCIIAAQPLAFRLFQWVIQHVS